MPYCRDCGTEISSSSDLYCGTCANDIIERSRDRIRNAEEDEKRRMQNDRDYAHSWLQDLIGWIIGLMDLMSRIFSGGCYITSAVVAHHGLADTGREMTSLRKFREQYIFGSGETGRVSDYEEYLIIGGFLRSWINSRQDAALIWDFVSEYVLQTVSLAESGAEREAYDLFKSRTRSLRMDVITGVHRSGNRTGATKQRGQDAEPPAFYVAPRRK